MNGILEILGSGTSVGVPMPACSCPGCLSSDPCDKRLRSSALLQYNGVNVVIDTTTDFRQQALRARMQRLDAVLLTHNHADHVMGLDDVRPFCFRQEGEIPFYGSEDCLRWVRGHFNYIWEAKQVGGGLPRIELNPVRGGEAFDLFGARVTPLPVLHGELAIYGYRIGNLGYICDVSHIPDTTFALLAGIEYLIIDGLRTREHPTHFNFAQAIAAARRSGARRIWFTHISHDSLHAQLVAELPEGFAPAYDGMKIEFAVC